MREFNAAFLVAILLVSTACNSTASSGSIVGQSQSSSLPQATSTPAPVLPVLNPTPQPTPAITPSASPTPSPTPYVYTHGSGTQSDPFQIYSTDDFQHVQDHLSSYFTLENDIFFDGYNFHPIGTEPNPFSGTLYGSNHIIYDLSLSVTDGSTAAVFGAVSGTIVELKVYDFNISSNGYASGLVGKLTGMLSTCTTYGTISSGLGGNGYNTGTGTPTTVSFTSDATVYNVTQNDVFNGNRVSADLNFGKNLPTSYSCNSHGCTPVANVCTGPAMSQDCKAPNN